MAAPRFTDQLNVQIGNEFAAHNQYLACAVHYDALTMPQLAGFFYGQALEERGHAMMMVKYLLDSDAPVEIPGVEAPVSSFEGVIAPVELAVAQEKEVTEQIKALLPEIKVLKFRGIAELRNFSKGIRLSKGLSTLPPPRQWGRAWRIPCFITRITFPPLYTCFRI